MEDFLAQNEKLPSARRAQFNSARFGAECEVDSQGRVNVNSELRRELGLDGQELHVYPYNRNRIRILTAAAYQASTLDAETAKKFGADGIGLCRTEHMFFDPERISAVRQMIMAPDEAGRRKALALLLPFQRDDFHKLFRIMGDLPITIRLLDPPLHEFLPHEDAELEDVARALGANIEAMRSVCGAM